MEAGRARASTDRRSTSGYARRSHFELDSRPPRQRLPSSLVIESVSASAPSCGSSLSRRVTSRRAPARSPLDPRRPALREGAHLLERRHRGVAGERRDQRAVRPAELDGFLGRLARQQPVEKPGREAVAAADAVVARRARTPARRRPGRRSRPRRPSCGGSMECTSRSVVATTFIARVALARPRRSCAKKAAGSSFDLAATSGPAMPRPCCRSSSLPTSTSTFSTMRCEHGRARGRGRPRRARASRGSSGRTSTTAPAAAATCMPSRINSPVVVARAPRRCRRCGTSARRRAKIASQSKSPGFSSAAASLLRL